MGRLEVTNPATGKVAHALEADSPESIRRKYAAARRAQPAWAATPLRERLAALRRFRAGIVRETESLARLLTTEVGKPVTQARSELRGFLGRIDYFLKEVPAVLAPRVAARDGGTVEQITQEPLGVVANISAWNYPYYVGGNAFVPALLTGNAVLHKPSEYCPKTGQRIARLLHASGVPRAVFAVVIGGGEAGGALVEQPVDGVFFTGSTGTGKRIAAATAGRMIRLQLELGGKDPIYVCEDVDVAAAAAAVADGAFYNTGQSCCSVERIYVHRSVYRAFLEAFTAVVRGFRIGDPREEETYIGPLTRAPQLEILQAHVEDAVGKGARLLLGGHRLAREGNYFAPTVLADATHGMRVMREESFGPIIGLAPARDDRHAVGLMNDTEYGLTAGVYTRSRKRAEAILKQVRAGSAYWNCCDRVSPRLPWSGVKDSGIGVTLSREGIEAFTRPKAWHLRASG